MNIKRLKELVEQSGKSVHQIQVETELKSGQLYRILSGINKDVTFTTAERLAKYFNVSLDEFRKE